jgi:uncharacterized heparinase superfamily protein
MRDWRALLYGSLPYHLALWRPSPGRLAHRLGPLAPGDGARGAALLTERASPWDGERADERAFLHSFQWLGDLAALGTSAAAEAAASWTAAWLRRFDAYDPFVWRADILGDRLFAWASHFDLVGRTPGLVASLARQSRHLARVVGREGNGMGRLHAARGLVASCAALGARRNLTHAAAALARELGHQFFADGGHRARSAAAQLDSVRLLVDARAALDAADAPVPEPLAVALARAALMLRFFRHADGGFALFNGAGEGDAGEIERVLALAGASGETPATAAASGFERLQAGGTMVLLDCGAPPEPGFDGDAHAGTLSFEMSHGAERIIVNCGAADRADLAWQTALRATAAHSTLVIEDTNSAEIGRDGAFGARPGEVTHLRAARGRDLWVAASHDGYRARFGLVHARQLFLASDGADLRGEDTLTGTGGRGFTIRFHLHPAVEPALLADGHAVLLATRGGATWRFRAEGAVLGIGESIYASNGTVRKTRQILLDGHAGTQGARVRWALKREGAAA